MFLLKFWIAVFLTILILNVSHESIYYWKFDSIWSSPNNWDLGRIPCSNDVISFSDNPPLPVYLDIDINLAITKMNLPDNGIFRLASDIEITTPNKDDSTSNCGSGANIQFNVQEQHFWHNGSNWCTALSKDEIFERCDTTKNRPLFTHGQRVPCIRSVVILHDYTDFNFKVEPNVKVMLSEISISKEGYPSIRNEEGLYNYESSNLRLNRFSIPDSSGFKFDDRPHQFFTCETNDERNKLICSYVECRLTLPCSDPFKPTDHCCHVCGLKLSISMTNCQSKYDLLQIIARNFSETDKVTDNMALSTLMADTSETSFEVMFVDETSDGSVDELIEQQEKKFNDHLELHRKKNASCRIQTERFRTSKGQSHFTRPTTQQPPISPPSTSTTVSSSSSSSVSSSSKSSVGWGVSLFFIIFIIVVLILAFIMRHKIQRQYIPSIRQAVINLGNRSPYSIIEMSGRGGVVFDNSIVFDGSLSSTGLGSASFVIPDTSSSARLVENEYLNNGHQMTENARTSTGFVDAVTNLGKKMKSKLESVNPKMLFSTLEHDGSDSFDPADFSKSRKKRASGSIESAQSDFDFNNPVYKRPHNE